MKIKEYFTTKPKISIVTLIIILFFFQYVTPTMMLFTTPFVMGTLTPDISYEKTEEIYDNMAENLAESFSDVMKKMYVAGQGLAKYSFFVRLLFYGITWITYIAIATFTIYVIRTLIYYIIPKKYRKGVQNG
jgi:hypothetical protein